MLVFCNSLTFLFFETLLVPISGADKAPKHPLRNWTPNIENTKFYARYLRLGSVLLTQECILNPAAVNSGRNIANKCRDWGNVLTCYVIWIKI
jgi:hypothetical protein